MDKTELRSAIEEPVGEPTRSGLRIDERIEHHLSGNGDGLRGVDGEPVGLLVLEPQATTALIPHGYRLRPPTGNVMLAFAAGVLGLITGLQRRSTGGIVAPILTHVTWSMGMLFILPPLMAALA